MPQYQIIVGNVGIVYYGISHREALTTFEDYVDLSVRGIGRAAGEGVCMMRDGQITREHRGTVDAE